MADRRVLNSEASELGAEEGADAAARRHDLVLAEGDGVSDRLAEEVRALDTGGDFDRAERPARQLRLVGQLGVEQVVAGRRRLLARDAMLVEGMQQRDFGAPVLAAAPVEAAAEALRRNARHVLVAGEAGSDDVVLAFDAEGMKPDLVEIVLGLQLAAEEGGVALGVDDLGRLGSGAAAREILVTADAGETTIDDALIARRIERGVEAPGAGLTTQAELDGLGRLLLQVRIADLERAGSIMRTAGEELRGLRCAFISAWRDGLLTGLARKAFPVAGGPRGRSVVWLSAQDADQSERIIALRNGQRDLLLACYDAFAALCILRSLGLMTASLVTHPRVRPS